MGALAIYTQQDSIFCLFLKIKAFTNSNKISETEIPAKEKNLLSTVTSVAWYDPQAFWNETYE